MQHPGLRLFCFLHHAEGLQSPIHRSQPVVRGSPKGYPGGKIWLFSINFSFQEWLQGKEGDIGQRLWGLISNSVHLPSFFFPPQFFFSLPNSETEGFPSVFLIYSLSIIGISQQTPAISSQAPDTCRVTNPLSTHFGSNSCIRFFPQEKWISALHRRSSPNGHCKGDRSLPVSSRCQEAVNATVFHAQSQRARR